MTALGPLLAATDFSPSARHAAERAARLARETGSPLSLLHVVSEGPLAQLRHWLGPGHRLEQQVQDEARQRLDAAAQDLRLQRHVTVDTTLARGAVADEIGRTADGIDAALVVVGARGDGALRRLALGTTAEDLLHRTRRPVLVVRQTPHAPYRRVLVAVDFSPASGQAVALARRLAPHARLVLFHAYQVPYEEKLRFAGVDDATITHYRRRVQAEATAAVHRLAEEAGLVPSAWDPLVAEGEPSWRIVALEQEQDVDLVVMGRQGQSAVEDLLLGSVSRHVLAEGSGDVLVCAGRTA